jgi:hypothetical protein
MPGGEFVIQAGDILLAAGTIVDRRTFSRFVENSADFQDRVDQPLDARQKSDT